jgi:hypothetical protein
MCDSKTKSRDYMRKRRQERKCTVCKVVGCEFESWSGGYCKTHKKRLDKYGTTDPIVKKPKIIIRKGPRISLVKYIQKKDVEYWKKCFSVAKVCRCFCR